MCAIRNSTCCACRGHADVLAGVVRYLLPAPSPPSRKKNMLERGGGKYGIKPSKSKGETEVSVAAITAGSVADKCGQLKVGMIISAITTVSDFVRDLARNGEPLRLNPPALPSRRTFRGFSSPTM